MSDGRFSHGFISAAVARSRHIYVSEEEITLLHVCFLRCIHTKQSICSGNIFRKCRVYLYGGRGGVINRLYYCSADLHINHNAISMWNKILKVYLFVHSMGALCNLLDLYAYACCFPFRVPLWQKQTSYYSRCFFLPLHHIFKQMADGKLGFYVAIFYLHKWRTHPLSHTYTVSRNLASDLNVFGGNISQRTRVVVPHI